VVTNHSALRAPLLSKGAGGFCRRRRWLKHTGHTTRQNFSRQRAKRRTTCSETRWRREEHCLSIRRGRTGSHTSCTVLPPGGLSTRQAVLPVTPEKICAKMRSPVWLKKLVRLYPVEVSRVGCILERAVTSLLPTGCAHLRGILTVSNGDAA
jgi:hypothetical protein